MGPRASDWFEPIETPAGWMYSLRPGDRGQVVWFSWQLAFIVIGLFVPAAWVLRLNAMRGFEWRGMSDPFLTVPLVIIVAGSWFLLLILQKRMGWDELWIDARSVRAVRRLGPVSWRKTVRRSKVARLTVVRKEGFLIDDAGRVLFDAYALAAEDGRGRRRDLVANYSRELLLALAVELSTRWKGLSVDLGPAEVGPKKVAVGEESDVPTDIRERPDAPLGTRLVFERQGEHGVRITVPPDGFFSPGPLGCSLVGVLCLGSAVFLAAPLVFPLNRDKGVWWGLFLITLVGMFAFVGGVSGAIYGCVLVVTPETLTQEIRGLCRTSRRAWKRSAIRSIRAETKAVEDSEGGTSYHTRVLIHATSSIKSEPDELELLVPKPELEWIATTLRGVLGVPASEAPTDAEIRAGLGGAPLEALPWPWDRERGD